FDPSKLYRIKNRFSGSQVIQIKNNPNKVYSKEGTQDRKLQVGDYVAAGTPLATIYSINVGRQKNDLIDTLINYNFDNDIYTRAKGGAAIPQVQLDMYRKNAQVDVNAIKKARESLAYYDISDDEIKAVEDEAEAIIKKEGQREPQLKKTDGKEINPW